MFLTSVRSLESDGINVQCSRMNFNSKRTPTGQRRTWRDVVNRVTFRARLDQQREPTPRDNLGMELTEALRRAIQTYLNS